MGIKRLRGAILLCLSLWLVGCASAPQVAPPTVELGRSQDVIVRVVQPGETARSLSAQWLGNPDLAHRIVPVTSGAENGALRAGQVVAISLRPLDPGGTLERPGLRVPILCYHRFSATRSRRSSKLDVSAAAFAEQLNYLNANGYTIVPLSSLIGFLRGEAELPPKPVAITIDDGYRSAFSVAFPVLHAANAPATLFVYTDFIGAGAALSWDQIRQMQASGLVSVAAHSKTHSDLTRRRRGESSKAYGQRLAVELAGVREKLAAQTGSAPAAVAYPYGAADAAVVAAADRAGYQLGLTVLRGGNATWAPPLLLKRDMIYGDMDLKRFAQVLHAAQDDQAPQ